jgi:hypothetical protein
MSEIRDLMNINKSHTSMHDDDNLQPILKTQERMQNKVAKLNLRVPRTSWMSVLPNNLDP